MAGFRGRPRKVSVPEPVALEQQENDTKIDGFEPEPEPELAPELASLPEYTNPVMAPLNTQPTILRPMEVVPTRERFEHVMEVLKPAAERGFSFSADNCSITITKGRCSECLNITNTDAEFRRALNRVAVAAAAAGSNQRAIGE